MKTMTKSTVLFDLDGTLLDSAKDLHQCLNQLLSEHQLTSIDLATVQLYLNHGAAGLIELGFGKHLSTSELSHLHQRFLNLYHELLDNQRAHFFPGTLELIQELGHKQITWGIVTNKHQRFTLPILKNIGLFDKASVIICGDMVKNSKPDPEPLLLACEQLGVNTSQCCYVGDSLADMQAAKAAQMPGLLACWGYWPRLNYSIADWPCSAILYKPEDFFAAENS